MKCRPGCGACCVIPSISSQIPGMPEGKPAFTPCVNFNPVSHRCEIWMSNEYPDVCRNFTPTPECCGSAREEAIRLLSRMEELTKP